MSKWQKEKPNRPCLVATRTWCGEFYDYNLFEFKDMGYLAVVDTYGDEAGDWDDLDEEEYFVIEYYGDEK